MANQWKYSVKQDIKMPKVEGSMETAKMKAAVSKALVKGAQKGASYVEAGLITALNKSMDSQWTWNQGSRDIVDTGKLKASAKIITKFAQTKVSFQVQYNTPYAAFVHYGGVMKPYGNKYAADVIIPGRPWVKAVLEGSHGQEKFDFRVPFDRGISEQWSAQFGT